MILTGLSLTHYQQGLNAHSKASTWLIAKCWSNRIKLNQMVLSLPLSFPPTCLANNLIYEVTQKNAKS